MLLPFIVAGNAPLRDLNRSPADSRFTVGGNIF